MAHLLLTIETANQSLDLEVPDDVPLRDLIPILLESYQLAASPQWRLMLPDGTSLQASRSLSECGVVDGTRLLLTDGQVARPTPDFRTRAAPTFI